MTIVKFALLALLIQSPQPRGVKSLEGVVQKPETNEPISKAVVELRREGTDPQRYTSSTVNDGRFVFYDVPPGQYQLSVTRPGYVRTNYGQRRPDGPGTPIKIPVEPPANIRLVMTPTGVISGRIINQQGLPVGNATVHAMKASYSQGVQRLSEVQSTFSNDLGEYRLFWLTPGTYYVGAEPTVGARRGVGSGGPGSDNLLEFRFRSEATVTRTPVTDEIGAPIYFPGTLESQSAAAIDVKPGAEVRGIDIFAAPVKTRHIRGVVISAETGLPLTGAPQMRVAGTFGTRFTSSPTTNFDISRLMPGSYTIAAVLNDMSGRTSVELRDQDLDNVTISISSGFEVGGKIVVEGTSETNPGPDLKTLRVSFRAEPDTGVTRDAATVAADGAFVVKGVYSGPYRVSVGPVLQNAYVKSIRIDNTDALTDGARFDGRPSGAMSIVISASPGIVEGTVVNERQEPLPNATVVLIPDAAFRSRTDLFKNVSTDPAGRFKIQAVTPGNYTVYAWIEIERGAWMNQDFMRQFENQGATVQVREGQTVNITLPAIVN